MSDINKLKYSLKKYLYLLILTFIVGLVGIVFYYKNFHTISGINTVVATIDKYQDKYVESPQITIWKTWDINDINKLQSWLNLLDKSFTSKLKNFISNIWVIQEDFKTSKEHLNLEDPKYYFNLWNLYLFSWYFQALSWSTVDDYLTSYLNVFQSKIAYDKIIQTSTWDILSQKAATNKNMSEILEYLINIKLCINIFENLISKLKNLSVISKNLKDLFDQENKQLTNLINTTTDQSIKQCLVNYQKELNSSYGAVATIDWAINKFIDYSVKNINDSIDQNLSCYEKKQEFTSGLQQSVGKIENSLNNFLQIHWLISKILESKDPKQLEEFCKNSWNNSEKSDQLNKDMNQWLDELNKILNQDQPQQWWDQQKDKQGSQPKPEQKPNQKSDNKPQHEDILNEDEKNLMDNVEKKNMNWIEEMEDIKWSWIYDPKEYLNNLFKEFKWNWEDFNSDQWTNWPIYDKKW